MFVVAVTKLQPQYASQSPKVRLKDFPPFGLIIYQNLKEDRDAALEHAHITKSLNDNQILKTCLLLHKYNI